MKPELIRNLAIIAHVDHGKTTLVDAMLRQSGVFHEKQVVDERVMDRNDLERERGITIMAKNTAVVYGDYRFNIVDTPGHSDFGGEVERIVQMVDGVLLLVDAFEGPMPQTRFVLRKALAAGLVPVVVINKVDRPNARPVEALDEVLDLFIELDAGDEQLEFAVVYANARLGVASLDPDEPGTDLKPLFETIVQKIPAPAGDVYAPLQLGVTMIEYDPYLGRQAVGRVHTGRISAKQEVAVMRNGSGMSRRGRIAALFVFDGLKKVPADAAGPGEIVVVAGLDNFNVGDTVADLESPVALDFVPIDEPTVAVIFRVNKSPFAGQEGAYVTSRKLGERLYRELESDVSLRVQTLTPDTFLVSGRGELHLSILIETMRREGYEFELSRPQVIEKEIDGAICEPVEELVVEIPETYVGVVMERLGPRRSALVNMVHRSDGQVSLKFHVPTRGLFGFRSELLTDTKGLGTAFHSFHHYAPAREEIVYRRCGSLVAFEAGATTGYGLENAQERGELFVGPGVPVYRGMVVGEHARPGDLPINVCKKKQLTNVRSSTSDISVKLTPPRQMSLEQCLGFIAADELMEVTPKSLRLRKQSLW